MTMGLDELPAPEGHDMPTPSDSLAGIGSFPVTSSLAVRPAFELDLSKVLYASDASSSTSGKASVSVGSGWSALALNMTPGAPIKFTFLDTTSSITTPELTLKAGNTFDFARAATSSTNGDMFVSGFLQGNDNAYARLVDATASGSFTLSGATVSDGAYVLHVYGEEINGHLFSDFASDSVDFGVDVGIGEFGKLFLLRSPVDFGVDGGSIGLRKGANITGNFAARNGACLDFHFPGGMDAGAMRPILTASGTADIGDDTAVSIVVEGNSPLKIGDQVVLIDATGGFGGKPANDRVSCSMAEGILKYDFDLSTDARRLFATLVMSPQAIFLGPSPTSGGEGTGDERQ